MVTNTANGPEAAGHGPVGPGSFVDVEPERPRRSADRPHLVVRVLRGTWVAVTRAFVAVAVAVFLLIALGPHVFGYRTATMLTGSMSPLINPGDVIVSVEKPAADVKVGDVITYYIPVQDRRVETHRVVKVTKGATGRVSVVTKGDANAAADPWVATLEGKTVYELAGVVPHAGTVIRTLREPFVQRYVFWGALGLLLVVGMRRIWGPEPLVDTDVLDELADELGDAEAAAAFAGTWGRLLEPRVARVADAVRDWDVEQVVTAALSLEVTGQTVGALRVAALASGVVTAAERGRVRTARRRTSALRRAARRTAPALAATTGTIAAERHETARTGA